MRAHAHPGHRGNIDDRAAAGFAHGGDGVLRPQQDTAHVDVEHAEPLLRLELREDDGRRRAGLDDARVVHHDVEPAESRAHVADHRAHGAIVGDVRGHRHGAAAIVLDQPDTFARGGVIDVVDGDGGAATRQPLRRRATDPQSSPRDERDSAFELHGIPPCR